MTGDFGAHAYVEKRKEMETPSCFFCGRPLRAQGEENLGTCYECVGRSAAMYNRLPEEGIRKVNRLLEHLRLVVGSMLNHGLSECRITSCIKRDKKHRRLIQVRVFFGQAKIFYVQTQAPQTRGGSASKRSNGSD